MGRTAVQEPQWHTVDRVGARAAAADKRAIALCVLMALVVGLTAACSKSDEPGVALPTSTSTTVVVQPGAGAVTTVSTEVGKPCPLEVFDALRTRIWDWVHSKGVCEGSIGVAFGTETIPPALRNPGFGYSALRLVGGRWELISGARTPTTGTFTAEGATSDEESTILRLVEAVNDTPDADRSIPGRKAAGRAWLRAWAVGDEETFRLLAAPGLEVRRFLEGDRPGRSDKIECAFQSDGLTMDCDVPRAAGGLYYVLVRGSDDRPLVDWAAVGHS